MINKLHISEAKGIDDTQGIVEAYVNTMGVKDHDGDVINSEAFDSSIRSRLPIPVLSGHDQSQLVGKVLFAQSEHIAGNEHRLFARSETVTMPETVPDVETEPQEPTEPHESEPEEPETDTGADQPDEPGQAAPDTDVQSASSTVQARLRLLRSRLQLQGIKTN